MNEQLDLSILTALKLWGAVNDIDCVRVNVYGNSINFENDSFDIEFRVDNADDRFRDLDGRMLSFRQLGIDNAEN